MVSIEGSASLLDLCGSRPGPPLFCVAAERRSAADLQRSLDPRAPRRLQTFEPDGSRLLELGLGSGLQASFAHIHQTPISSYQPLCPSCFAPPPRAPVAALPPAANPHICRLSVDLFFFFSFINPPVGFLVKQTDQAAFIDFRSFVLTAPPTPRRDLFALHAAFGRSSCGSALRKPSNPIISWKV